MIPLIRHSMPNNIDENDEIVNLNIEENSEIDDTKPISYMGILCNCTVQLCLISIVIGYASITFFEPVIAFRLLEFTESVQIQSLVIVCIAGGYTLMNICISYVEKLVTPIALVALGMLLAGLCNFMIGPSDFLPQNLIIIAIGLTLLGIVSVFCTILQLSIILKITEKAYPSYERQASDYCSNIYSSLCSLGLFLGPIYGGGATEVFGYKR